MSEGTGHLTLFVRGETEQNNPPGVWKRDLAREERGCWFVVLHGIINDMVDG